MKFLNTLLALSLSFAAVANEGVEQIPTKKTYVIFFTNDSNENAARNKFYNTFEDIMYKYIDVPKTSSSKRNYVARKEAEEAHPIFKLDSSNTTVKIDESMQKMISSIQRKLEVMAIDNAIIVDCFPRTPDTVSSCGLYNYERALAKITFSSVRNFKIDIDDPSMWADKLLSNFVKGESIVMDKKAQKRMDEIAKTDQINSLNSEMKNSMSVRVNPVFSFSNNQDGPGVYGEVGYGKLNQKIVLNTKYSRYSTSDDDFKKKSTAFGLGFRNTSNEINGLNWELGYGLMYESVNEDKGSLHYKKNYLDLYISPGFTMPLPVLPRLHVGMNYSLARKNGMSSDGPKANNMWAHDLGIILEFQF